MGIAHRLISRMSKLRLRDTARVPPHAQGGHGRARPRPRIFLALSATVPLVEENHFAGSLPSPAPRPPPQAPPTSEHQANMSAAVKITSE